MRKKNRWLTWLLYWRRKNLSLVLINSLNILATFPTILNIHTFSFLNDVKHNFDLISIGLNQFLNFLKPPTHLGSSSNIQGIFQCWFSDINIFQKFHNVFKAITSLQKAFNFVQSKIFSLEIIEKDWRCNSSLSYIAWNK